MTGSNFHDFRGFQRSVADRNHRLLERHREHEAPYTVEFMSRELVLDPHVFCPTIGEGSVLLAEAIEEAGPALGRVLDLGTGSGAQAIVAARHADTVVAVDLRSHAVRCARANVERLGLADRIEVRHGDLFEPVEGEAFDLILFNPPFLEGHPHDALESAVYDENYDLLKRFFIEALNHLNPGGRILLAFGDVGSLAYLGYLIRGAGLRVTGRTGAVAGPLEFFVLELRR
jgi:release factor glutamine methyltransferase